MTLRSGQSTLTPSPPASDAKTAHDAALHALQEELAQERRQHHAARQEINRLRRKVVEHAQAADRARDTVSYRLGAAILRGKTLPGLLAMPWEILALVRESVRRRKQGRRIAGLSARTSGLIDESLDDAGIALEGVRKMNLPPPDAATVLMGLAAARAGYDLAGAARLAKAAVSLDPNPRQMGQAAQILYMAGQVREPAEYAHAALHGRWLFSQKEVLRLRVIESHARAGQIAVPPARGTPGFTPEARRIAFVCSSALPHHVSGYTLRTQNVASALLRAGWDVRGVTRAGYPWDRNDARELRVRPGDYEVDGVPYHRLKGPSSGETPLPDYIEQSAQRLCRFIQRTRPALVYAASNHLNGLPALIAARRCGLPFVYGVRGLWEMTAAAKTPGWEATERFALQRDLEIKVAEGADRVIALSQGLRTELIARGVAENKIVLAPNGVDLIGFQPVARDRRLAQQLGLKNRYVIGFLGSLEHYEGLDDLLEAASILVAEGLDLAVLIVGDGSAAGHLREEARRLELGDRVVQTGRVAPGTVANYYSVVDVAVFPRRPLPVCEVVAPLKPLEAMAMAKPVVASSVSAMAEMITDGHNGLLFEKGSVESLAATLGRVASDPILAKKLGANARAWVERERGWDVPAGAIARACTELILGGRT